MVIATTLIATELDVRKTIISIKQKTISNLFIETVVILIATTVTMASRTTITMVRRGILGECSAVGLTTDTVLGRLQTASPMNLASF